MKKDFLKYSDKIYDLIDAAYVTDENADQYLALKTTGIFEEIFGNAGSYQEMLKKILVHSSNKLFQQNEKYSSFLKNVAKFEEKNVQNLRLSTETQSVLASITCYPLGENKNLLIINTLGEQAHLMDAQKEEKEKMIRSAYLFSMRVDLDRDFCSNVSMSEVDPMEQSSRNIDPSYFKWRDTIVNMVHPKDQEAFLEYTSEEFLRANLLPHRSKTLNCQMINLEGRMIWVKLIFNRIENEEAEDFCFVFMIEDINDSHTELMDELSRYEDLAKRDSLTGLLNHGSIEAMAAEAIEEAREQQKPLSLIMLDLDHYKRINDTYGHAIGDKVLITTAEIAAGILHPEDCQIGRWGGEEFIAVCRDTTAEKAAKLADSMRKALATHLYEEGFQVTSSFGVLEVMEEMHLQEAFANVDRALYQAKKQGRNCVVVHKESI